MWDVPEIPGYRMVKKLGEGGMSSVYSAIQEKLSRKVAIKILKPSLLKNTTIAARFEREAKTAATLYHSNIIQIFDVGKSGQYNYIVMEYLEESLKDLMRVNPKSKMHPEIALDIVEDIMKALDYAHNKRVYHRDIKPDNIMFRVDGTPVLVDFGIAQVFESHDRSTSSDQPIGTIFYMSPEQCKTQEIDGRTDIYSLGVVLYEMLTGQKPYTGKTLLSVAIQHIQELVPKLPEKLSQYQPLIDKMMAKNKDERVKNASEFLQLLDKVMMSPMNSIPQPAELPSLSVPKPPPPQAIKYPVPPAKGPAPGFTPGKPDRSIKQLIHESLDLSKEKLAPLIKQITASLRPGSNQEKLIFKVLIVVILVFIVFIILFSL